MNRRGFLTGILALGAAPAIVRADSLMRIVPRDALIINMLPPAVYHPDSFGFIQAEISLQRPFIQITREALMIAHEKAKIMNKVDCDTILYGPEVASVLRIRQPNPYKGRIQ